MAARLLRKKSPLSDPTYSTARQNQPGWLTGSLSWVYDQATGALSFDADGNGAGAAVALMTLTGNPTLTASDLALIA